MINTINFLGTQLNKRPLFFYGAGRQCRIMAYSCSMLGLRPDYVVDQNPKLWGESVLFEPFGNKREVTVISPDEMLSYGLDNPVLITTVFLDSAIKALRKRGFTNLWIPPEYDTAESKTVLNMNKLSINSVVGALKDERSKNVLSDIIGYRQTNDFSYIEDAYDENQYFPPDIITLDSNDVFIDGGAYDGKTTEDFIRKTKENYSHAHVFEPVPANYSTAASRLVDYINLGKVTLIEKALSDKKEKVIFFENRFGSHMLDPDTKTALLDVSSVDSSFVPSFVEAETVSLDAYFEGQSDMPSFIKLDVEGAEMDALVGARGLIEKHRPKLAVSIYHKFEDLFEIPLYLMQAYPFYDFYIRHHQLSSWETTLYAVP